MGKRRKKNTTKVKILQKNIIFLKIKKLLQKLVIMMIMELAEAIMKMKSLYWFSIQLLEKT